MAHLYKVAPPKDSKIGLQHIVTCHNYNSQALWSINLWFLGVTNKNNWGAPSCRFHQQSFFLSHVEAADGSRNRDSVHKPLDMKRFSEKAARLSWAERGE